MRTYDRAEEKRLLNQAWDRDALKLYWEDYDRGFNSEDLIPFWKPYESVYDINIDSFYRFKLLTLLSKLNLRSPYSQQFKW